MLLLSREDRGRGFVKGSISLAKVARKRWNERLVYVICLGCVIQTSTAGRQRTWVQDLGPDLGIPSIRRSTFATQPSLRFQLLVTGQCAHRGTVSRFVVGPARLSALSCGPVQTGSIRHRKRSDQRTAIGVSADIPTADFFAAAVDGYRSERDRIQSFLRINWQNPRQFFSPCGALLIRSFHPVGEAALDLQPAGDTWASPLAVRTA
jgi:hypothetical protein